MRTSLIILSIVDALCCGWMLFQIPIVKIDTDWAVSTIESKYLRSDLTTEERDSFDFFKWSILNNQQVTSEMLASVKVAGIVLGATLLVQNLVLLFILNGRRRAVSLNRP